MSTTALVSVEEYLRRTEKPNCEYIDGVLHPKPMPSFSHSGLQYRITDLLRKQGAPAFPELTVRLSPTRFLIPDVTVVRFIDGSYPTDPVLLCVEILSPEQKLGEMLAKCEQYHAWGVPFCWVIDPQKRSGWEYHAGSEPNRIDQNATLQAGELTVSMDELFTQLPA